MIWNETKFMAIFNIRIKNLIFIEMTVQISVLSPCLSLRAVCTFTQYLFISSFGVGKSDSIKAIKNRF